MTEPLAAVAAGFVELRDLPFSQRAAGLRRAADLLEEGKEEFARWMAREMGKPVTQGIAEVAKCASACRFYADRGEAMLAPQELDEGATLLHQPLGPVLAIMPWNFPFWQVFRFAAPALMAGNTILLKHASNVSGCATAIVEVMSKAFGRDDFLQAVFVSGKDVEPLIADPRIRAVTFTGSTDVGRAVAAAAGRHLKKSVLELGGSDPYLVLDDADLDHAAKTCAAARMVNAGQSCIAAKRFLVAEDIYQDFLDLLKQEMAHCQPGDPLDPATKLGFMAKRSLRDELHAQVTDSVKAGARLLLGGEPLELLGKPYYPPTLLAGVGPGMRAFDEETFGPVAAVMAVHDEFEAIHWANQSSFGLGAAVFSKDERKARRVAAQLDTGTVAINSQVVSDPRFPFGGVKDSGWGRELGEHGIREFVNVKTVRV
ncbi:NAD-dependent succinate-semialdehyde dehydrogenase [Luteolibacter flavescens]|uniref:NAD-dependent succinate-semialdehyde dehydrogenase n=1 Tax=Luteolibacter flavescens TaxID=1859460 RepID=A0ABT3FUZ7_9BACT|nr:NAD-dependent succinate-semialdehyde dehydrogenase [Luteolibacter flavescens]MCW1887046.1 NAD-dependent succinate-semialdehyde dehydrogenase [Luteolibacter flavescens]